MQQTIQAVLGAVAVFLAGVVVLGALAAVVLAEGYYLVGFGTRLYWRCKENLDQIRGNRRGTSSDRDQPGRQLDHTRRVTTRRWD
jgi:hypothetical protein